MPRWSQLKPAAAVAVVGAGAVAENDAEVEAAATEAVPYVEIRAEAGYWGREREEVPAAEASCRTLMKVETSMT